MQPVILPKVEIVSKDPSGKPNFEEQLQVLQLQNAKLKEKVT